MIGGPASGRPGIEARGHLDEPDVGMGTLWLGVPLMYGTIEKLMHSSVTYVADCIDSGADGCW